MLRRWIVLVLALWAGSLTAQTTTGFVEGQVLDAAGKASPGALVCLESPAAPIAPVETDRSGRFRFSLVPVGGYTAWVGQSGSAVFRRLRVQAGRTTRIKLKLRKPGAELAREERPGCRPEPPPKEQDAAASRR
jgi:hypothetical protein